MIVVTKIKSFNFDNGMTDKYSLSLQVTTQCLIKISI